MIYGAKKVVFKDGKKFKTDEELMPQADIEYHTSDNGAGRMLWWNVHEKEIKNGGKYIGQWTSDKFKSTWKGLGIIKFEDGSRYVGQTDGGILQGRGHMVHSDGSIYHGDYSKGQANGKGTLWDPSGIQYEGTWKDDEYNGKGEELLNFGKITYKGDFQMGRKTGKAVFTFENDG